MAAKVKMEVKYLGVGLREPWYSHVRLKKAVLSRLIIGCTLLHQNLFFILRSLLYPSSPSTKQNNLLSNEYPIYLEGLAGRISATERTGPRDTEMLLGEGLFGAPVTSAVTLCGDIVLTGHNPPPRGHSHHVYSKGDC